MRTQDFIIEEHPKEDEVEGEVAVLPPPGLDPPEKAGPPPPLETTEAKQDTVEPADGTAEESHGEPDAKQGQENTVDKETGPNGEPQGIGQK